MTIKIRLKKLKELDDPEVSNIKEGFEEVFHMIKEYYKPPTLGKNFRASLSWSTSPVLEIIDDHTFRTHSSLYEWQIIK